MVEDHDVNTETPTTALPKSSYNKKKVSNHEGINYTLSDNASNEDSDYLYHSLN